MSNHSSNSEEHSSSEHPSGHLSSSSYSPHASENERKQSIFVVLVGFLLVAIVLIAFFSQTLAQNIPWIVLLVFFFLIVWKGSLVIMLEEYERGVISRFGRVARVGGPGWTLMLPLIESIRVVDLRTQVIDLDKQDVITKDQIELKVDAVIYLKVGNSNEDIINSIISVQDYREAARLYIISTIRNKGGSLTLSEIIANVDQLNTELKLGLARLTKKWGVEVEAVEIKDVDIPRTILEAMHAEKAAVQERLARLQRAEAQKLEIEAIKSATADLSERAMAYYYVKALEELAKGQSTKFIFPMELSKLAENISGKLSPAPQIPLDAEPYKELLMKFVEQAVKKTKSK